MEPRPYFCMQTFLEIAAYKKQTINFCFIITCDMRFLIYELISRLQSEEEFLPPR